MTYRNWQMFTAALLVAMILVLSTVGLTVFAVRTDSRLDRLENHLRSNLERLDSLEERVDSWGR